MRLTRLTSFMLRGRPDQTVETINAALDLLEGMQSSIRIVSKDKKNVIIIGEQPVNPSTGLPYSFGIHTYEIKGDRLEEI